MAVNVDTISLRQPDDWHVHLRDGAMLAAVVPYTARQFARAIVMPNLMPPVTDVEAARAYRDRILAALPKEAAFTPLMTCYLTDTTDPEEIAQGYEEGVFAAVKLYPAHATTNSASGVTDYDRVLPVFERMAAVGMPLLIHGEREKHRQALRRAATSGNRRFFLGTDSAPHAVPAKETACGCAGIFTAPCALQIYAEVFEEAGALDRFEAFAALNGPEFYRLPVNETRVTLRRKLFAVPESIGKGENALLPFRAGETLRWRLVG